MVVEGCSCRPPGRRSIPVSRIRASVARRCWNCPDRRGPSVATSTASDSSIAVTWARCSGSRRPPSRTRRVGHGRKPSTTPAAATHLGQGHGVVVAEEARRPDRAVLVGGAVEALELPQPVEDPEHRRVEAGQGPGAEPLGVGEHAAEHAEVQGDPRDADLAGPAEQLADHQLGHPVGGVGRSAHDVERGPRPSPGDEGQQPDEVPVGPCAVTCSTSRSAGVLLPAERHREPSLRTAEPPAVGGAGELGEGVRVELVLAADPDRDPGPGRPFGGLSHRRQRRCDAGRSGRGRGWPRPRARGPASRSRRRPGRPPRWRRCTAGSQPNSRASARQASMARAQLSGSPIGSDEARETPATTR